MITVAIATPSTDYEIRLREWNKGHEAFKAGLTEDACPWTSGLTYSWWMDGYRSRNYPTPPMVQLSHIPS